MPGAATETVPAAEPELPQPQAETGSGTEPESDESAPELEEQLPHRHPHKPGCRRLESMKNQTVKQNRAGVKRRPGRLCPNGLRQVTGVTRVTIRKSKNTLFLITKPEVHMRPAADTYIVFGKPRLRIYLSKHS
ncbi:hypothetical protein QTO34_007934 [Cnephaeus nilssonii]|uniref:NAC-A/B domain-containing protein n=1 Tax=Cnephaeus nilssonii TaxID=3371016 RepID=A0AA40IAE9_CNENI|nr:hypothetical protein QTO34_007934 [Eptesicus nilssonii]